MRVMLEQVQDTEIPPGLNSEWAVWWERSGSAFLRVVTGKGSRDDLYSKLPQKRQEELQRLYFLAEKMDKNDLHSKLAEIERQQKGPAKEDLLLANFLNLQQKIVEHFIQVNLERRKRALKEQQLAV